MAVSLPGRVSPHLSNTSMPFKQSLPPPTEGSNVNSTEPRHQVSQGKNVNTAAKQLHCNSTSKDKQNETKDQETTERAITDLFVHWHRAVLFET